MRRLAFAFALFLPLTLPAFAEAYRFRSTRYFTNKPPCGPKRGHGSVQPRFANSPARNASTSAGPDRGPLQPGSNTTSPFDAPFTGR